MRTRFLGVDAIRGLSALAVLFVHANIFANGQLQDGPGAWQHIAFGFMYSSDSGVDMLFVVSGYLVALPWMRSLLLGKPLPSARDYARRRVARIVPAFWVALVVAERFPVHESFWAFVRQAFLLEPPTPSQSFGLFVAWSLQVEVVFYLAMPLLCVLAARRLSTPKARLRMLLTGSAATVLLGIGTSVFVGLLDRHKTLQLVNGVTTPVASPWVKVLRFSVPSTIGLMVPGVLLAAAKTGALPEAFPRARRLWAGLTRGPALLILVVGVMTLELGMEGAGGTIGFTLSRYPKAVAFCAILTWTLRREHAFRTARDGARRNPLLVLAAKLGTISYGVYLWHCVWLSVLPSSGEQITDGLGTWIANWVMLVTITIPCAIVSWYVLERPAITWSLRARSSRPASVQQALVITESAPPAMSEVGSGA